MTANSHPGLCGSTGLGGGRRSPPHTHTPRPCARPAALRTLRGPPRDRGLRGFPPCGPAWACAPCEYLWGGRTCPKRRRLRPCPPRLLLRTRAQTRGQTLLPWDGRDTEGWWPGPRPALRPRGPWGPRCARSRARGHLRRPPVTATAPRCRRAAFTLPCADAPRPAPQARMCLGPPHPRVRCGCAVSSQVRCPERARPPRDSWGLRSPHPVPEPRRSRASGSLRSGLRGADSPCTALGPAAAGFLTLFNQRKQRRFSPEHRA